MPAPEDFLVFPGMTVTADLSSVSPADTPFILPASAVTADADKNPFVWVVDESEMRVHKVPVEAGRLRGSAIEVAGELEPGSRVVVAGVGYLTVGMEVRLLAAREEAEPRADEAPQALDLGGELGIPFKRIGQVLQSQTLVADAGNVAVGADYLGIWPTGESASVQSIGDALISSDDKKLVHIGEIAEIRPACVDVPGTYVYQDGRADRRSSRTPTRRSSSSTSGSPRARTSARPVRTPSGCLHSCAGWRASSRPPRPSAARTTASCSPTTPRASPRPMPRSSCRPTRASASKKSGLPAVRAPAPADRGPGAAAGLQPVLGRGVRGSDQGPGGAVRRAAAELPRHDRW